MDDIPYNGTTVYLSDGSVEYAFGDPSDFFDRLLREKLGEDAARFFRAILVGKNETIEELKTEVKGFERSAVICFCASESSFGQEQVNRANQRKI